MADILVGGATQKRLRDMGDGTFAEVVALAVAPSIDIGDVQLLAGTAIVGKVGIDQTTPGTTNGVQVNAGEAHIGQITGYIFDVVAAPAVTAGAYSAGDIMGALMSFAVSRVNDEGVVITRLQFSFKAAVTPSLLAVILNADPTATTKTDNAPYSLDAADTFKVVAALPVNALGGYLTDHGTPNTISLGGLSIPIKPATGTKTIYMLLVDLTGVTLGSTSDLQVRVSGVA